MNKNKKNRNAFSDEISKDMKLNKLQGSRSLTIPLIIIYSSLLGLSIYCSYICYKSFYDDMKSVSISGAGGLSSSSDNIIVSLSFLVTSLLILVSILLFLSLISIFRWYQGTFRKGEHVSFFSYNLTIFCISFIISVVSGLIYVTLGDNKTIDNRTPIFIFFTYLAVSILTFIFLTFYSVKPSYLTH